jgi:photosystem II stability/assembly factor-like uncharacterized protein
VPPGQTLSLTSITLFGKGGWATTSAGCSSVLRTADGGTTWSNVAASPATQGVTCTPFFLDAQRAWLVVPRDDVAGRLAANLERPSDGGATWTATPLPDAGVANALFFNDALHGWYAAIAEPTSQSIDQPLSVWATSDGGTMWHRVNQSPFAVSSQPSTVPSPAPGQLPDHCGKNGLSFATAETGWVTGGCLGSPTLYVSHNGGLSWYPQALPAPAGGLGCDSGPCFLEPPRFTSSRDGTMLLEDDPNSPTNPATSRVTLYTTHNSGATWTPRVLPDDATIQDVSFLNATAGWAVSVPGGGQLHVFETSDGGLTWRQVSTVASPGVGAPVIDFVDARHGLLIAGRGASALFATSDGGRTWGPVVARLAG